MKAEDILTRLQTKKIARHIRYFTCTDSTNIQAKLLADDPDADGMLVIADKQTRGRGRSGRVWSSPPHDDIFMSLLIKPQIPPVAASMLTLVAAMAVADAIEEQTGLSVSIKWPNDIVINHKKVCGILTEMSAQMDSIHYIVVGIGINVNTKIFPREIADMASSLWLEAEHEFGRRGHISRSVLIILVMQYFEQYYEWFLKTQDLSAMQEMYNKKLAGVNGPVKLIPVRPGIQKNAGSKDSKEPETIRDSQLCGISRGITARGGLLVEFPDGSIQEVSSGEVSVRGLYGYI